MSGKAPAEKLSERLSKAVHQAKRLRGVPVIERNVAADIKPANALQSPHGVAPFPSRPMPDRQVGTVNGSKPLPAVRLHVPPASPVADVSSASGGNVATATQTVATPEKRDVASVVVPSTAGARPIGTAADIGDVIRHARRVRGMSQADLAVRAGTGRRFVSELEAGKPTIEIERLLAVCRALEIGILAAFAQP